MMKLKTDKILTKEAREKNINKKNKDQNEKDNIWKIVIEELNWEQTKLL